MKYKEHLAEALFVVLGVVLAFGANEWRQTRADAGLARAARVAVVAELRANREAVAASQTYHAELVAGLTAHLRDHPAVPADRRMFTRGFIHPADTLGTAWEAAAHTGALRHMTYADVLRFSRVYAEQVRYERQQDMAGTAIYRLIAEGGTARVAENPAALRDLISGFAYREKGLVATYDALLREVAEAP